MASANDRTADGNYSVQYVPEVAMGSAVTLIDDEGNRAAGVIVDDFRDLVDIATANDVPAPRPRRWAVALVSGGFVFSDEVQLVALGEEANRENLDGADLVKGG